MSDGTDIAGRVCSACAPCARYSRGSAMTAGLMTIAKANLAVRAHDSVFVFVRGPASCHLAFCGSNLFSGQDTLHVESRRETKGETAAGLAPMCVCMCVCAAGAQRWTTCYKYRYWSYEAHIRRVLQYTPAPSHCGLYAILLGHSDDQDAPVQTYTTMSTPYPDFSSSPSDHSNIEPPDLLACSSSPPEQGSRLWQRRHLMILLQSHSGYSCCDFGNSST